MQEFNRGLFDFLIATDDPVKQEAGKAGDQAADPAADTAAEQTASTSQQADQDHDPAGDDQVEAPDHPWADPAASGQPVKVLYTALSH